MRRRADACCAARLYNGAEMDTTNEDDPSGNEHEASPSAPDGSPSESGLRTISARDFVTGPYVRCPACGTHDLGVLMIEQDRCYRRCRNCLYPGQALDEAALPLPPLTKKIVYLDQFVISFMMKVLDPRTRESTDKKFRDCW